MPNTYFRFKQFTIEQENCAQKVSTDACILGAWIAGKWKEKNRILDIGAGTGLQMLMIAQQVNCQIHGIEIEDSCFSQLNFNINQSHWKDRLVSIHGDARTFHFENTYDGIVVNPPFFENDLPSRDYALKIARHDVTLTIEHLFEIGKTTLCERGELAMILPVGRLPSCLEQATLAGFFVSQKLMVRHSPGHDVHRAILVFKKSPSDIVEETELSVYDTGHQYSDGFHALLKDYYLNL